MGKRNPDQGKEYQAGSIMPGNAEPEQGDYTEDGWEDRERRGQRYQTRWEEINRERGIRTRITPEKGPENK
jgi:hypothetical protein